VGVLSRPFGFGASAVLWRGSSVGVRLPLNRPPQAGLAASQHGSGAVLWLVCGLPPCQVTATVPRRAIASALQVLCIWTRKPFVTWDLQGPEWLSQDSSTALAYTAGSKWPVVRRASITMQT